jgi:hypothetical protein
MVPDLFREEAGVVNPNGSRIACFLLMKSLHQCDGADDALKAKTPLGPAGPVYALGLWCVPFLAPLRNASLRSAPEHTNALLHRLMSVTIAKSFLM